MGLIIMVIVEYIIILATIAISVWICLRYRKNAAAWKDKYEALQAILKDYEEGRYKYLKLVPDEKAPPKNKKAKEAPAAEVKAV